MSNPNENRSFLDKNTILAVVITMLFFFGWSTYMRHKYPEADKPVAAKTETATTTTAAVAPTQAGEAPTAQPVTSATTNVAEAEVPTTQTFIDYSTNELSFRIGSFGMGIDNINLKHFQTRDNKPIILGQAAAAGSASFATGLYENTKTINFQMTNEGNNTFKGVAVVDGMTIEKVLTVDPSKYLITSTVKVTNAPASFKGLTHHISDVLFDEPQTGLFGARAEVQDLYYTHDGDEKHNTLSKKSGAQIAEKNVGVLALSSHYFTLGMLNKSDLLPRVEANIAPKAETASARLIHQPVNPSADFNVSFEAYAGPKQLSILENIDPRLGDIIHYGMFAWIAKPLLKLLKFLNGFLGNWGLAIIALTLIVRVIVMPFNIYSFKSMKIMQKLQPEMQRLRERYKDDPQTMNREVMDLMKRNKANPLGGCLPMLLQLPVFIALYSVLGQSIELYRAPFFLWITDLSVHDKFFVLPVLMGITMYVQQKITPNTMDPAQAKVLQFMPIIFTAFMLFLPSGLTLYIFVSTLFGIIQQYVFMREKTPGAKISQVQA